MAYDNTTPLAAKEYDGKINNTIPYYQEFYHQTLDIVEHCEFGKIDWLDLGGGTGSLEEQALQRFADIHFVLVDPSEKMVEQAREKLKEVPIQYICAESSSINFVEHFEVVTALQSHHYMQEEERRKATECVSPSTYIKPVVALARRISAELGLDPVFDNEGKQTWWRIPFWGSYREDSRFEWKLRPKLAKAMAAVFPELGARKADNIEDQEDDNLVSALKQATFQGAVDDYECEGKPKKKQAPIYSNGHKVYPRDRQTAINALVHAHYECECQIGNEHPTFVRRNSDKNYTEPHHLVPMSESDQFDVSLDVEENIVSLCSNCHNKIHYGRDAKGMIIDLYESRKASLENVGIYISLESLLKIYKVS